RSPWAEASGAPEEAFAVARRRHRHPRRYLIVEPTMHVQHADFGLPPLALVLLVAAVASVPIARRLGLSAIVAYLIAGIIIGPYGLGVFGTPESIIPVSELGVVMLLFLIGLELELGRLLAMRRAIFGLGAAQLALT